MAKSAAESMSAIVKSAPPGLQRSRLSSRDQILVHSTVALIFSGVTVLSFSAAGAAEAVPALEGNPLVGTWLLTKYVDIPEGGAPIFAFGEEPVGQFIFTAGMHVSFSIMRNPPDTGTPTTDPDPDACIPGWYCAYFGTYSVDAKKGVWVTHVLSANIPGFLDSDQPRHFTIKGDTLVVSETYFNGSKRIAAERVFVREKVPGSRRP